MHENASATQRARRCVLRHFYNAYNRTFCVLWPLWASKGTIREVFWGAFWCLFHERRTSNPYAPARSKPLSGHSGRDPKPTFFEGSFSDPISGGTFRYLGRFLSHLLAHVNFRAPHWLPVGTHFEHILNEKSGSVAIGTANGIPNPQITPKLLPKPQKYLESYKNQP